MNILITGISGFVGSNFVDIWGSRHTLFGLDTGKKPVDGVVQIFNWDKLNEIPNVDAIVHLAGKAHDTKNKSLAETYIQVNVGLTKKIFDYFLLSDAKTFIYFSSVKAAADYLGDSVLDEDFNPHPVGPYGESKLQAEEYIQSTSKDPRAADKKIYILRPCLIHGPGNKGNLNLLYSVVRRNVPWPLGSFDNKRSLCSIENIAFVTEQLFLKDTIPNATYNVSDDEFLSTNELIDLICSSLGKKAIIWNVPKGLINGIAKVGGLFHLPLNEERLQKLTENYIVSNKKIKSVLNIDKMPVTARQGFIKTLESF